MRESERGRELKREARDATRGDRGGEPVRNGASERASQPRKRAEGQARAGVDRRMVASRPRTGKDVVSRYPELKREAEEQAKPIIENETEQATRDQTAWIQPK